MKKWSLFSRKSKEINNLIENGMKMEMKPHLGKKERIENVVFYMQVAMQQERRAIQEVAHTLRYGTGNGARFYYRKR